MATTIQVMDETRDQLQQLRKTMHAESYDEVIKKLMNTAAVPKKSLYGFLGKKNMKEILEGLRDETDRF
ncbi:MAG: hypothetical protein Q7R76_02370 [Candidatus Woesearchaeota archaeon]|nr:hypothetical protein [Candidatus Woesearchaeota archaeon]